MVMWMASAPDRPLLGLCRGGLRLYGKIHYAYRPMERREETKRKEGEKEERRGRPQMLTITGLTTAAYEYEGIIKPRLSPVIYRLSLTGY